MLRQRWAPILYVTILIVGAVLIEKRYNLLGRAAGGAVQLNNIAFVPQPVVFELPLVDKDEYAAIGIVFDFPGLGDDSPDIAVFSPSPTPSPRPTVRSTPTPAPPTPTPIVVRPPAPPTLTLTLRPSATPTPPPKVKPKVIISRTPVPKTKKRSVRKGH